MHGGVIGEDSPLDRTRCEDEIVGPLATRDRALGMSLLRSHLDDWGSLAGRTPRPPNCDALGHFQPPVDALFVLSQSPSQGLVGADVHSVTLVIEIGTLVYALEIGMVEMDFGPSPIVLRLCGLLDAPDP